MEVYEVVTYAISREIEAAEFYRELQGKVKHDSSKTLLKDLEQMERSHAKNLTDFSIMTIANYMPAEISDLKISDSMVEPEMNSQMTFQDILVVAMKREEVSNRLYNILANETDDVKIKNMFLRLAEEEAKHKLMLETIYDDEILKEN